jgi:hypothetical protein
VSRAHTRPIPADVRARLRLAREKDPDLTCADLAERFGYAYDTIWAFFRTSARAPRKRKPDRRAR